MRISLAAILLATMCVPAVGAVTATTLHGPDSTSLDGFIAVNDAISGLIATEVAGDQGWHGANTDPADQLPAFTDDAGIRHTGLTGLLNDFPMPVGSPVKRIQYDLVGPTPISAIQILTGNNGKDGRVFSTFTVHTSNDNGDSFNLLGYFQSDPSGTINSGQWGSTLVTVSEDGSPLLAGGVTNLRFDLYAVDNTGGQMRDPFDGVNPFTGADDGLSAAFVSPLVFEIDVIPVPEPTTFALLACAVAATIASHRRRR